MSSQSFFKEGIYMFYYTNIKDKIICVTIQTLKLITQLFDL